MDMLRRLIFVFWWAACCLSCSSSKQWIDKASHELAADSLLQSAHVGICLYEPETKSYWLRQQSHQYFIPASNVKLFSLYAALHSLPDSVETFRYLVRDSVIYLKPSADPSFLHPDFPDQPALTFLQSFKRLYIVRSSQTQPALYGEGWMIQDITAANAEPRSAFPVKGNREGFWSEGDKNLLLGLDDGSVNAKLLQVYARVPVITIDYSIPGEWKPFYSRPLDAVLVPMMHESDNFMAEQVLLMSAYHRLGRMDDRAMMDSLLSNPLSGLPQKPRWADASGLSRYNLFTPESMVWLLNEMQVKFGAERMQKLLPTGNQGTLRKLYLSDSGRIFAKTGTLSNNQALSGYLITQKGKRLTFSVMCNHYPGKPAPIRRKIESFLHGIINMY